VGARLTGSDGRGQHVGITLGRDRGRARPLVMRGEGTGSAAGGPLAANRWAVGGGCLLTPRALFLQVDGFDEQMRHPFYRELDYCRRVTDAGHRCVYAAEAELTRPGDLGQDIVASPREEAVLRRTLPTGEDGFRSPYFTVADGTLRLQPRRLARHFRAPVRTLMCSFNLNREGAAWSQYELTVCLKEAGILDPVVFCPHDGPLRPAYEARGIEVRVQRHPLSGVFAEAAYARAIASFATLIRETGANLVYGNTAHTFYAIDAADAAGVPSVWNPRESEPPAQHFQHFGPAVAARALECFRLPYRVVFVADATREIYRSLETEHNFTVVHNGLDMARLEREAGRWTREEARRSLGIGDDEVVLLVLGTVCERKGQADLPSAVGRLPERLRPRVRCLVVGDRGLPYSRRVEAARAALPIELRARVTLLPETDEPFRFFRAADVFVCTSRIESFPRVTLEAMACGLPLVTTPVFGIREQVREGVNALFYQPGDTAGLGAALARLLEDDALRHHLAAQARPVLECLNDFDAMAEAYAEIFREASLTRAGALAGARGRDQ
jgi:glycosyltransferase involved in cell wall biosynthesis